jgi:hypothetical protein
VAGISAGVCIRKPGGLGVPDYENLREKDTRWTPVTQKVVDIILQLEREAGNRVTLGFAAGVKPRQIYRIVKGKQKCVSLSVFDRLLARSSIAHRLEDFPWYTIEEIQEMGLWDQPLPHIQRKAG